MKKELKSLEEICDGTFKVEIQGEKYCKIALIKPIDCIYQDEKPDDNGMYRCQKDYKEAN